MNQKFAISIIKIPNHEHYKIYEYAQNLLYFGLSNLGFDVIITDNHNYEDRRYIILAAFWLKSHNDSSCEKKIIIKNNSIVWNLEQCSNNLHFDPYYLSILKNYEVWDFDYENAKRLNIKFNLNIYKILEFGFVRQLQKIVHKNFNEKDIDLLFIGGFNKRRLKILKDASILGLKVHRLFGVYGYERDQFIARSKLLLNLHISDNLDECPLEKERIGYYLNNACAVLSEQGNNSLENLLWSQAICVCKYEELAFKALELLNNPGQIAKLQVEGLNFFKKRKMEDYLKKVL